MDKQKSIAGIVGPITQARLERGWSASELARRAGVVHSTVTEMERGKHMPKVQTLYALWNALEMEYWSGVRRPERSR